MPRPRNSWPLLRWRKTKTGKTAMVDCGMMNGKRIRFFYKTMEEAQGKAAQMRVARQNEGTNSFTMPAPVRHDAEQALALLEPHNITLKAAAEFYITNLDIVRAAKPLSETIEEFVWQKEADGRAQAYLQDLTARLRAFSVAFPGRVVSDLTAQEIDDWLRKTFSPVNRNNYRRVLSVLFGFAVKRRYVLKNPVKDVEVASVTVEKPGILTLDESRALLQSANPDFLPVIALGLFAGLRPESEVRRLSWKHIDWNDNTVDIQASKNVASHRFVKMSRNLLAWLAPYQKATGPVFALKDAAYFERMRATRERARGLLQSEGCPSDNLQNWPSDCLRHTFASNHYAAWKNAADTAEQLGHSGNMRMFFRHYRNRIKEAEALAFWQIFPSSAA